MDPAQPPAGQQNGEAANNMVDEELLRALQQTEEIGELEATDLMQFAYQIASGMVRTSSYVTLFHFVYSILYSHWSV